MSSTFSRWRKVELLDLAEKLKISNIPNHVRKNDLIDTIESHLNILNEPLDIEVDYPELKSFYDSVVTKHEEEEEEGEDDQEQEQEQSTFLDTSKSNFNTLNFSEKSAEDEKEDSFKFNFQNYLSDIISQVKNVNESIQDSLSTIHSIDIILFLIEFYYILKPLIVLQEKSLSISTLSVWITCSYLLPILIGYYINFIRYDLAIEIDPMIFHVSKCLISLAILNYTIPEECLTDYPWLEFVQVGMKSWKQSLGQLPLIFAISGTVLTLYIF